MKISIPLLCLGGAGLAAFGFMAHAATAELNQPDRNAGQAIGYVYVIGPAPGVSAVRAFGMDAADPFVTPFDSAFANHQDEDFLLRRLQRTFATLDRQAALLDINPVLDASAGKRLGNVCIQTSETRWTPHGAQVRARTFGDCAASPQDHTARQPAAARKSVEFQNII